VVGLGAVDQSPHVVAVDPVFCELVDQHIAVQERDRDDVCDVHLRADRLERADRLPAAMLVGALGEVDLDVLDRAVNRLAAKTYG
jgi:hypothetical protein